MNKSEQPIRPIANLNTGVERLSLPDRGYWDRLNFKGVCKINGKTTKSCLR